MSRLTECDRDFFNLYDQGFARVAAVTLPVFPAQPDRNAAEVIAAARECTDAGVAVAVYPELTLTGYSIDDLFLQDALLDSVDTAITHILNETRDINTILVFGAPVRTESALYNCAIVTYRGTVCAVIPKTHLPNYREFYEKRYFSVPSFTTPPMVDTSRWEGDGGIGLNIEQGVIPIDGLPGFTLGVEICEDMWVPHTPAIDLALQGATVIVNLSASPITVGRSTSRELLIQSASARLACAYIYAASGQGESSTDLAWDGQTIIYECGEQLATGPRFTADRHITVADVDLDHIRAERSRQNSFDDNAQRSGTTDAKETSWPVPPIPFEAPTGNLGLIRHIDRFPFVPDDPARLEQDCYEAYSIQVSALVQRLQAIGNPKLMIGVSGGLDSTHALIVAAKAMDQLGRPRTDIMGYTMPGFATSDSTKSKAWALGKSLGISFEEIDIRPAARQMLADMGHPYADGADQYDVTFENVQAGLRTDYLFRLANHHGGIVLGTGDLSELALGWCTYGVGDQMSHYGVNAGVPKTMIQHLIRWVASTDRFSKETNDVLLSILDQEISPELVPAGTDGQMQSTQDRIGPYNLQDFNLYYVLRRGYRPSKIAFLAWHAWSNAQVGVWPAGFPEVEKRAYSLAEIVKWEQLFLRRFFSQQFKRSAMPNGPKVMAGGSLSPRGDWRMPSDVSGRVWLEELDVVLSPISIDEVGPASVFPLPSAQGEVTSL